MPFALTPPPGGAAIQLDRDAAARPRIEWRLPEKTGFSYWSDLGCAALLVVFLVGTIWSLGFSTMLANNKDVLGVACCCSVSFLPVLGLLPRLLLVLRAPVPAALVFGSAELSYTAGRTRSYREKGLLSDWWALLGGGRPAARIIRQSQITQVRLDRLGNRQRLLMDLGAERLEIGASLSEPEREWLIHNLIAWTKQIPDVLPADRDPPSTGIQPRPNR